MLVQKTFSWRARARSFSYAWAGIRSLFGSEHNLYLHAVSTIAAVVMAVLFRISLMEAMILALSIALVWMAELFNTAIEKTADLISSEYHPQIKLLKDVAAAAVLVAAIAALLIGAFIFLPKLL